jgi:hypothetical protein
VNADQHGDAPATGAAVRTHWLDRKRNVDLLVRCLYAACGTLMAADILVPKHGPFGVERTFGFYGWFGFAACVGLVLAAKQLRRLLMRPEDYYDR